MNRLQAVVVCVFAILGAPQAQIPKPTDAPPPLSPGQSRGHAQLPEGFQLDLVASEPLISEPSGLCWDEHGRLFVCELHGYNLEGQFDIDELNKTGQLDREVRRVQAGEQAKAAAQAGTFGTVKLLTDADGDGLMDKATVFADRLPPAYGICAARGGIIVACAPDILFLADRDGDGRAEVQQKLFSGFATGALERGINQPQWGLDNWIYFGRGHGGGTITGPKLAQPVLLPNTDFRIQADGSAIEPITGNTHTFGHAFTEEGERFTATTSVPGRFVIPLPWRYLARNPDAAAPGAEQNAADYTRVFPAAAPHPWRSRRAADPGFSNYYRQRYGAADSDPGGWFTSGCGLLVYQDSVLPNCRGAYFVCEPAQNLIHRALIERNGPALLLRRFPQEQDKEFLASSDPWFHPTHLAHAPDGTIGIVDMYREIIEDYSAVPRYLQQQYGLTNGINHGRIWKLTHRDVKPGPHPDMSRLDPVLLARETGSPYFWRRQTARRLLVERNVQGQSAGLAILARETKETAGALNALYTLQGLKTFQTEHAAAALKHPKVAVRRHGLRFAEPWLDTKPGLLDQALLLANESDPSLLLQLALTLGDSRDPRVLPTLATLARRHGEMPWMAAAILSGLHQRGGLMLDLLLSTNENPTASRALLEPLCASIGARTDDQELAQALQRIENAGDSASQVACLRGLQIGLKRKRQVTLAAGPDEALHRLVENANEEVSRLASALQGWLVSTDPLRAKALLAQAARELADPKTIPAVRLAAVGRLAASDDPGATTALLASWQANTPIIREAILDAFYSRRDRLLALVDALENKTVEPRALNAFQRVILLEHEDPALRARAARLLARPAGASDATFARYAAALAVPPDPAHGERVFREHCSTCHQAHGIGFAVGPNLDSEYQRAEETLLKDILAPNDSLSAGYDTYLVETIGGESFTGILASESATALTLRMPAGLEQVILRKDLARLTTLPVSLMPEGLRENLQPDDVSAVIAFVRDRGQGKSLASGSGVVLFDEEPEFVAHLHQGNGGVTFATTNAYSGKGCLTLTPLQRYSAAIPGWNYRIVEKPAAGQYRYLRLAWKVSAAKGAMIELAADGHWPDAENPQRRYYAGQNTTPWQARALSRQPPNQWRVVTVDLWKDCGAFTLTGIAPTALEGTAYFDRIELLQRVGTTPSPP